MDDWRDRILKEFAAKIAPLTLVADPDGLPLEESLLEAIRERGLEILRFEDSVAFRFACESRFRSRWDQDETADLVVVVRAESHQLATLPHDLSCAGLHRLGRVAGDEREGICRGTAKREINDPSLAVWTIKALLFAMGDSPRSASALFRGPHLFPFHVALPSMRDLEACEALEISRHGFGQEVLLTLSKPNENEAAWRSTGLGTQ